MALIDEARAEAIYDAMGPAVEISGGSAANTIVGRGEPRRARAPSSARSRTTSSAAPSRTTSAPPASPSTTPPASDGPSTARCYILVTPDGERTMNTYLGAAQDLHPNDIDADADRRRRRSPISKAICGIRRTPRKRSSRRRRSRTTPGAASRSRCRMRSASIATARSSSISSATAPSISCSPTSASCTASTRPPISTPRVNALRNDAKLAVVTRSEKGCLVVTREETDAVPASPIERVVDATGAGDLFAAGFLVGLARGADHRTAARLGALAAAEVIQHLGARPETSLKALAASNGFDL